MPFDIGDPTRVPNLENYPHIEQMTNHIAIKSLDKNVIRVRMISKSVPSPKP